MDNHCAVRPDLTHTSSFLKIRNHKLADDATAIQKSGGASGQQHKRERTGEGAALFYSLIESAKLTGAEPRAYLGEAARQAIRSPGAVTLARDLK